jgi:hypothetical protein
MKLSKVSILTDFESYATGPFVRCFPGENRLFWGVVHGKGRKTRFQITPRILSKTPGIRQIVENYGPAPEVSKRSPKGQKKTPLARVAHKVCSGRQKRPRILVSTLPLRRMGISVFYDIYWDLGLVLGLRLYQSPGPLDTYVLC